MDTKKAERWLNSCNKQGSYMDIAEEAASYLRQALAEIKVLEAACEMYHGLLVKAMTSFECYVFTGKEPKPKDQWDEYDHSMGPIWQEIAEKLKVVP
jgi:hypothetical protein